MNLGTHFIGEGLSSIFDLFGGLPIHPLVAHFAVVLLPLAGVGLLICVFMPSMRRRFGLLAIIGAGGGATAAFVAAQSGEQLAKRVGLPQEHAALGQYLPYLGFLLCFISAAWFFAMHQVESSSDAAAAQDPLRIVFGGLTAGLALAVVIGTTVVGHSGAVAVWEKRINPAPAPSQSATPTQDPSLITADDLAAHSSTTDCWTAIAGKVYDLTPWLVNNPGDLTIMCGGTSSNADITVAELASYEVGTLDTSTSGPGYTAAEVAKHSTLSLIHI